jgi:hypothetical protein
MKPLCGWSNRPKFGAGLLGALADAPAGIALIPAATASSKALMATLRLDMTTSSVSSAQHD